MNKNLVTATALIGELILASFTQARSQEARGFTPCASNAGAQTITATGSSSNVTISACGPSLILYNIVAGEAFYRIGPCSGITATTSDYSIPGNTNIQLVVPNLGNNCVAAITSGGTVTLRLSQGVSNF